VLLQDKKKKMSENLSKRIFWLGKKTEEKDFD